MGKLFTEEEVDRRIKNVHGNKIRRIGVYTGASERMEMECEEGHKWFGRYASLVVGVGCPKCANEVKRNYIPWNKGKIFVPIEIQKQRKKEYDKKWQQSETRKRWRAEYRKRPEVLAKERAQVIKYRSQPDARKKRREYLNRIEIRERTRYLKRKRREDVQIRLNDRISRAIHHSLKNGKQWYHWEDLVGYTTNDLKWHLEKQFKDGMSWDNYRHDGWHIDHIIPLKAFNFNSCEDIDFKRAWALDNLQPLWGKENMSKGVKLKKPFQPYLDLKI
jgi:hypothetical protein